jgi:hypothetical protein
MHGLAGLSAVDTKTSALAARHAAMDMLADGAIGIADPPGSERPR